MNRSLSKIDPFDRYSYFLLFLSLMSVFIIYVCFPENRLYYGPDSSFHYARIEALVESLKDGRFPVYIDYTRVDGYGYGAKLFYSDFLLLPVAILSLFFSLAVSFKIYLFFIFVLSGHFTYRAVFKIFKSKYISVLASLLITFSYYKLYSLTYRGALGEILSYVFIPLVVIGSYELIKGNSQKWYLFSIGFALLLMSHLLTSLLTGLMLIPFFLFYARHFFKEKKRLKHFIYACIGVLVLSSYGLLPMFEQLRATEFFLKTQSAWASPAQTKLSLELLFKAGLAGMPTFAGVIGIGFLLPILLLMRFFVRGVNNKKLLWIADCCLLVGLLFLFLISELAPWGRFPLNLLTVIQFPWRLFEYVTFFWAISISIYFSLLFKTKLSRLYSFSIIVLLQIIVIVIYGNDYTKTDSRMETVSLPALGAVEYLPLKMQEGKPSYWYLLKNGERVGLSPEDDFVSDYEQYKSRITFSADLQEEKALEIPLLFYKGYTARFNGQSIPLKESEHGLVEIRIKGKGEVIVDFTGTFIQRYSFLITCIGFFFIAIYVWSQRVKRTSLKKNESEKNIL